MKVTQLIALNNKRSHMSEHILFKKLYLGDKEDIVYEFLNEMNDELSLDLSQDEIGKLFVLLTTNEHTNFTNTTNTGRNIDIYLDYSVEDL